MSATVQKKPAKRAPSKKAVAKRAPKLKYDDVIEIEGVKIPFIPEVITPRIEKPMRNNRYEIGECQAVRQLVRAGDRVLELGAGVGLISTVAARVEGVERVVSIEAHPKLIDVIRETHRINGVKNIEVRNGVAGRVDCAAHDFYVRADFWASSMEPDSRPFVEKVSVPGIALPTLLAEVDPSVLIIDIEGGEIDLFDGVDLASVRTIVIEMHVKVYGEAGQKRILDTLGAAGFKIDMKHVGGSVWILHRDSVFAANPNMVKFPTHTLHNPDVCIITCMKNEGPFILEWIAYHKSIGIHNFVIFSNDCTDGTDLLLDRLDQLGVITHLPNPAELVFSTRFQPTALKYASDLPIVRRSDYVIGMDVDEFLTIRTGQGRFVDLLEAAGPFHAMSVSELNFSSGGHEKFEDGWITEAFCEHEPHNPGHWQAYRGVKTIMNGLESFERLSIHRPLLKPGTSDQLIWMDGSGRAVPSNVLDDPSKSGIDRRGAYRFVSLNHYALRSVDSYLVKIDRGDVVRNQHPFDEKYYRIRSIGGKNLGWIAPRLHQARNVWRDLVNDRKTAELHDLCVGRHKDKIAELQTDPEMMKVRDWILANHFAPKEAGV